MGKNSLRGNERARTVLAQEAARIIIEQGIEDFRIAKNKAAERLGLKNCGSLPCNTEIQTAISEHLQLFGRESHLDQQCTLRRGALAAMDLLAPFKPRLVGPVLDGTAAANSPINLHVFSDTAEMVALKLDAVGLRYQVYERRLKSRRDRSETYLGYRFQQGDLSVEATVFPITGIRQAPISSINGRPMRRANHAAVRRLLTISSSDLVIPNPIFNI